MGSRKCVFTLKHKQEQKSFRVFSSSEGVQPFVMEAEGRSVGADRAGVSAGEKQTLDVLGPNVLTDLS